MSETPVARESYTYWLERAVELGFSKADLFTKSADNGRWECNDSLTVFVTWAGEIYTRKGRPEDEEVMRLFRALCPQGRGEFTSNSLRELFDSPPQNPIQNPYEGTPS